jgi:hypothetical protein
MLIENVRRGVIVTTSSFTKAATEETRRLSTFSRDRLTLELVDYSKLMTWLARTSDLSPNVTMPVRQIRERYAELVNKNFLDTLTSGEKTELQRLADVLDQADAPFYEPLKNALRKERDRLITESRRKLESQE